MENAKVFPEISARRPFSEEEIQPTKKRRSSFEKIKDLCSSFLVPLMIGVATIVVSAVQIYIAHKQREQDLLITSRNREQDLRISDNVRADNIFSTYIKEVSEILDSERYSSNDSAGSLRGTVRAKTLNVFRQLDSKRNGYLIQYLYDLGALSVNKNPIDLQGGSLEGIDLSVPAWSKFRALKLTGISLQRMSLVRASFVGTDLTNADFSASDLSDVNFHLTNLENAVFVQTSLRNVNFTDASCFGTEFIASDLRGSNIRDDQLAQAHSTLFSFLPNGNLSREPSLIINGNAESETNCSDELCTINEGPWLVYPDKSLAIQRTEDLAFTAIINERILSLGRLFTNDFEFLMTSRLLFDFGRWVFVVSNTVDVSMSQSFDVPLKYQYDKKQYSWVITGVCFSTYSNVEYQSTLFNIIEYDAENRTLNKREDCKHDNQ